MSSQLPANSVAEVPGATVLHHPPGLARLSTSAFAQIPGRRVLHQLLVRHARPEEVTQAAGDFIVRQRPHVSGRCRANRQRVDTVAEVRRHQHARHGVANRVFVTETLIAQRTVEREEVVRLRLRQRPAVRPPRTRAARRGGSASARPWPARSARTFPFIARSSRGPLPRESLVISRALAR
jgi:hypothetical protein